MESQTATLKIENPFDLLERSQLCHVSGNMWSRPATALLIEMYKKLDCLWKTNSVYYRNKKKRLNALQEIAATLEPFRPNTTAEDVKNKINGIRTQYVAEKNKVAAFAKQNHDYESSLWCYERMSFLAPHTAMKVKTCLIEENEPTLPNETTSKTQKRQHQTKLSDVTIIDPDDIIGMSETEQEIDEAHQETLQYISIEPRPKKFKWFSGQNETSSHNDLKTTGGKTATDIVERVSFMDEESCSTTSPHIGSDWIDVFGKFVSTQMRLISDKTLLIKLEHTIQSAIMDAQLKQMKLDSQSD